MKNFRHLVYLYIYAIATVFSNGCLGQQGSTTQALVDCKIDSLLIEQNKPRVYQEVIESLSQLSAQDSLIIARYGINDSIWIDNRLKNFPRIIARNDWLNAGVYLGGWSPEDTQAFAEKLGFASSFYFIQYLKAPWISNTCAENLILDIRNRVFATTDDPAVLEMNNRDLLKLSFELNKVHPHHSHESHKSTH